MSYWLVVPQNTVTAQETGLRPQDVGVYRDTIDTRQTQPFVLQSFVLPGSESLKLDGTLLDSLQYRIDYRHGRIWLTADTPPGKTLVVTYRTLPFEFKDVYRRRSVVHVSPGDSLTAAPTDPHDSSDVSGGNLFGETRLQHSGSITRGIIAGSNRDLSVESGLRLNLSGEVTEGVTVQAVLTDENTPIQPEGTTQRLSEFDRVAIQFQSRYGRAQLGDFDLNLAGSDFAGFNRKLQGISVSGEFPDSPGRAFAGGSVVVSGATTRGIFHSQRIMPVDGIQGPYRLEGNAGEQFIIVIAGSETVYLDGQRMTRGETHDYVIDYQTGEITFTPRHMITDDRRILVEFQYTTSEFTRTLIGTQVETRFWQRADGSSRLRLGGTIIREADSRMFNAELGLTSLDSLLLVQAGDGRAERSGAQRVVFDPEAPFVQYVQEIFERPDGGQDTIFTALTAAPPDSVPVYRVRFSRVGAGKGHYVRTGRAVNGILYEYRGPGQGDYDPIRVIPKPIQQRLIDFRGGFEPFRGVEIFGEWAQSLHDQNRLSNFDSENDFGHAYTAGMLMKPIPVAIGSLDLGTVSGSYSRRFSGSTFQSFDRTRPVEFDRKWNLLSREMGPGGSVIDGGDETTEEGTFRLDVTPTSQLMGEFGRIKLANAFQASRSAAVIGVHEPGLPRLDYQVEYIGSLDSLVEEKGTWLRQLGTVRHGVFGDRLVPRFEVEQERRLQRAFDGDSLTGTSLVFTEFRPGIAWVTERLETGGEVEFRREKAPLQGLLRPAATALTVRSNFAFRGSSTFNADGEIGYRIRRVEDQFQQVDGRENTESAVIRINSRYAPLKRAVEATLFYEALTERSPILQEVFVRTSPEYAEAQFVWEDTNGDGVVQIDEFIPERIPGEGLYARLYVPSDTLESAIGVQARMRIALDPGRILKKEDGGWRGWLSNVMTRTTVDIVEKSRSQDLLQIYLLNLSHFRDPVNTLNGRIRVAQDFFLFRNNTNYGLDFSFNQLRSLTEMAAGEEEHFLNTWRLEGRFRPTSAWGLRLTASIDHNRALSDRFSSRRYDIESGNVHPEISYSLSRLIQILTGPSYTRKVDALESRAARLLKLPLEVRFTKVQKLQATVRAEVASVFLDGNASGLALYELTDGRGPGTSFLWSVNGQYSLNEYLRASFSYNGRAPSGAPVLHTMSLQMSALF